MEIRILPSDPEPIYRQIINRIRSSIASGLLNPGDQIPAVRELAEQITINPNTVVRAYTELVREGIITGRPGSGYFVIEPKQGVLSVEERQRRLTSAIDTFITDTAFLDFPPEEIEKQFRTQWVTVQTRLRQQQQEKNGNES